MLTTELAMTSRGLVEAERLLALLEDDVSIIRTLLEDGNFGGAWQRAEEFEQNAGRLLEVLRTLEHDERSRRP
jgi:hypothetical protein